VNLSCIEFPLELETLTASVRLDAQQRINLVNPDFSKMMGNFHAKIRHARAETYFNAGR